MAASATNIAPRAVGEGSPHFAEHSLAIAMRQFRNCEPLKTNIFHELVQILYRSLYQIPVTSTIKGLFF